MDHETYPQRPGDQGVGGGQSAGLLHMSADSHKLREQNYFPDSSFLFAAACSLKRNKLLNCIVGEPRFTQEPLFGSFHQVGILPFCFHISL